MPTTPIPKLDHWKRMPENLVLWPCPLPTKRDSKGWTEENRELGVRDVSESCHQCWEPLPLPGGKWDGFFSLKLNKGTTSWTASLGSVMIPGLDNTKGRNWPMGAFWVPPFLGFFRAKDMYMCSMMQMWAMQAERRGLDSPWRSSLW